MKNIIFRSVLSLFVVLILLFSTGAMAAASPAKEVTDINVKVGDYVPGELVVQFKSLPSAQVAQIAKEHNATLVRQTDDGTYSLFRFADDKSAEAALKALKKRQDVTAVFRNIIFSIPQPISPELSKELPEQGDFGITSLSDDASRGSQWHLTKIKDDIAEEPIPDAPLIAVVDSGVDYTHVDLAGKVIKGKDFIDYDDDPMDVLGHGTHVAGIAAANTNNTIGVAGVSPDSQILAVRVLDEYGYGTWFSIASGIVYAMDYPEVKIINLSLGGYAEPGSGEYTALETIINSAFNAGIIVVCAAGNEDNIVLYESEDSGFPYHPIPAAYPKSFTVAATDENNYRAYFSNYSTASLNFVDIAAPGWNILSTTMGDSYSYYNGTSMSTPVIAGAAARVWAKHPAYTNAQVQNKLKSTGKKLGAAYGFPKTVKLVDLSAALGASNIGIQGQVIDATTGKPIKGATVKVKQGTTLVATSKTLASGFFTVTGLTASTSYKVTAIKPGYRSLGCKAKTLTTGFKEPVNFRLAPKRESTNWTIVVDWKSCQPGALEWEYNYLYGYSWMPSWDSTAGREMNSYLLLPDATLIFWGYPGILGEYPDTRLMRDSWNDLIPVESIIVQSQMPGTYKFAVCLDPDDWCWGKLAGSGAVVRVYKGTTLKAKYAISAATGTGTLWWYVFDLDGNTVTKKQLLQDTPPSP